ncbi:hypothetical protein PHYBOEH_009641 [Phytophthora boehmeriae]|uniref:Uncharacterized protein n=1 Tax=Phytophthora boehmeriae TaxID=109152 RepID=A0A8T1VSG7_9STRA|nr:hypothetical protein PHYBOEH_009641 [Phytophthora boehmeriae]
MLKKYGSKTKWLRSIAKRDASGKKQADLDRQRRVARQVSLKAEPSAFRSYLLGIRSTESDETALKRCSERFVPLEAALVERGVPDRGCNVRDKFIMRGVGTVDDVVDTLEEMKFLFNCVEYRQVSPGFNFNTRKMNEAQKEQRMKLCVNYLADNKGRDIPRKWEQCRPRFDLVVSVGASPTECACYIYSGVGMVSGH